MRRFLVSDLVDAGFMTCDARLASSLAVPDSSRDGVGRFIAKRAACVLRKAYANGVFERKPRWNVLRHGSTSLRGARNALDTYTVAPATEAWRQHAHLQIRFHLQPQLEPRRLQPDSSNPTRRGKDLEKESNVGTRPRPHVRVERRSPLRHSRMNSRCVSPVHG